MSSRRRNVMYGCSRKRKQTFSSPKRRRSRGGSNGPIAPFSWAQMKAGKHLGQQGGSCGSSMCSANAQSGGSGISGPLVGAAWGGKPSTWPGADGISGNRNYLAFNNQEGYRIPAMSRADTGFVGGKKRCRGRGKKSRKNSQMMGGALMQDLTNLSRNLSFNVKSVSNAIGGYSPPMDPNPYSQPYSQGRIQPF